MTTEIEWANKVARGYFSDRIAFVGPNEYRHNLVYMAESIPDELLEMIRSCPASLITQMDNEIRYLPNDWKEDVRILGTKLSQDASLYNFQLTTIIKHILEKMDITERSRVITLLYFIESVLNSQRKFEDILNIIRISARTLSKTEVNGKLIWVDFLKARIQRETEV